MIHSFRHRFTLHSWGERNVSSFCSIFIVICLDTPSDWFGMKLINPSLSSRCSNRWSWLFHPGLTCTRRRLNVDSSRVVYPGADLRRRKAWGRRTLRRRTRRRDLMAAAAALYYYCCCCCCCCYPVGTVIEGRRNWRLGLQRRCWQWRRRRMEDRRRRR